MWALMLILAPLLNAGCTTMALEHYTVNQSLLVSDLRYRQVLKCLAVVANDPRVLPSFAVISWGQTTVSDTVGIDSMTVWDHAVDGFSKQSFMLTGKRNPDLSWTVDPIASEPLVEGIRDACLWMLQGPPAPESDAMALLRSPAYEEHSGYHLGVADQLARIRPGLARCWLSRGCPQQCLLYRPLRSHFCMGPSGELGRLVGLCLGSPRHCNDYARLPGHFADLGKR